MTAIIGMENTVVIVKLVSVKVMIIAIVVVKVVVTASMTVIPILMMNRH